VIRENEDLERTGNSLLANHQEMHKHKDGKQPRKNKSVKAIEASEGGLPNTLTASEEFHHEISNDGHSGRDSRNNFHSPVADLIPWEGITCHTKGYGDHRHDNPCDPGKLTWALETSSEINPEDVQDEHEDHHARAPTVDGPDQPAKAHSVLD
jgi:hypothetical protein